jgi:hypothetical protein
MQEEVSQRSVTLMVQTGKMTGRVLLQAIQKYLNEQRHRNQLKAKTKVVTPSYKGRMTIKELMKERMGLSSIDIHDENIREFERIARKYRIEYAIKKEHGKTPPHYLVFFRGKDADVLQMAFKEFVRRRLKLQDRPSIKEKMQGLKLQHKGRSNKKLDRLPEKVQKREIAR